MEIIEPCRVVLRPSDVLIGVNNEKSSEDDIFRVGRPPRNLNTEGGDEDQSQNSRVPTDQNDSSSDFEESEFQALLELANNQANRARRARNLRNRRASRGGRRVNRAFRRFREEVDDAAEVVDGDERDSRQGYFARSPIPVNELNLRKFFEMRAEAYCNDGCGVKVSPKASLYSKGVFHD
jgi:hypothetical protein